MNNKAAPKVLEWPKKEKFDILEPVQENEFFWAEQFIINLPDFLLKHNLVASKREIARLAKEKAKVFLITKNSTFEKMRFSDIKGNFAVFHGEEIMVGNNFNRRAAVAREDAIPWQTLGFVSEE